jgi:hypothetical protein
MQTISPNGRLTETVDAKGRLTGEQVLCGYGPRLVIEFDRPKPRFINRGYNVFVAEGFEYIELDAIPDVRHDSNDALATERAEFHGWVECRFNDGERSWCFITPHSHAYDAGLKRYTKPLFRVQG